MKAYSVVLMPCPRDGAVLPLEQDTRVWVTTAVSPQSGAHRLQRLDGQVLGAQLAAKRQHLALRPR